MSRAESQVLDVYVEGINSGDVDQIPLADDVVFVGPMLDTPLQGADAVRDFLSQVSRA